MRLLKIIDWILLVVATASGIWSVALLIDITDAGLGVDGFILLFFGFLFGSVVWLLLLIGRWILRFRVKPKPQTSRLTLLVMLLTPVFLLSPYIVDGTRLGTLLMGARFKVSRASLMNYVKQAQSGQVRAGEHKPKRVGLFWVYRTEVEREKVWLITSDCGLDECGFVYSPHQKPPVRYEDNYVRFLNGWWLWHQSW